MPRIPHAARWRRFLQLILGLLVGGVLLWSVFRDVDAADFGASITAVDPTWLALAFVALIGLHLTRAWRWGRIVRRIKPLPFREVLSIHAVGYLAILVAPFRLGEIVRPYLLNERHCVPFGAAVYTAVLEATLDILALGVMFAIAVLFADLPTESIAVGEHAMRFVEDGRKAIAIMLLPFIGCLLAFALLQARVVRWTEAVVGRVHAGLARRIAALMRSFLDGVRTMADPRLALEMVGCSALVWVMNLLHLWALFVAFGFDGLGMMAALVMVVVLLVGILLPTAPLFVGTFEAFTVLALALYGIGRNEAAAYAVVGHVYQIVCIVGLALLFLWLDGIPSARIFRRRPTETTVTSR